MFRRLPVVARALLPERTPSNQDPYPRNRVNENRILSPEHLPFDQSAPPQGLIRTRNDCASRLTPNLDAFSPLAYWPRARSPGGLAAATANLFWDLTPLINFCNTSRSRGTPTNVRTSRGHRFHGDLASHRSGQLRAVRALNPFEPSLTPEAPAVPARNPRASNARSGAEADSNTPVCPPVAELRIPRNTSEERSDF